jgi:hypothetical protein
MLSGKQEGVLTAEYRFVNVKMINGEIVVRDYMDAPRDALEDLQGLAKNLFEASRMAKDASDRLDAIFIIDENGRSVFGWTIFDEYGESLGDAP